MEVLAPQPAASEAPQKQCGGPDGTTPCARTLTSLAVAAGSSPPMPSKATSNTFSSSRIASAFILQESTGKYITVSALRRLTGTGACICMHVRPATPSRCCSMHQHAAQHSSANAAAAHHSLEYHLQCHSSPLLSQLLLPLLPLPLQLECAPLASPGSIQQRAAACCHLSAFSMACRSLSASFFASRSVACTPSQVHSSQIVA